MSAWIKYLHRLEDALLVILLSVMILLAAAQILLRNLFESGFVWADPLLRVLVLWLGLLGAMVATRENRQIHIDLVSRFFAPDTLHLIQALVAQISAWTCLVIAWFGLRWIHLDFVDRIAGFAGIPAWLLEVIVPLSFGVIGLRYFYLSLVEARSYLQQRQSTDRGRR